MKGKYQPDEKSHRKDLIVCRLAAGQRGTQKYMSPHLLVHLSSGWSCLLGPSGIPQCWLPGHLSLAGSAHCHFIFWLMTLPLSSLEDLSRCAMLSP